MTAVVINMPNGGDERVEPEAVCVIREALDFEKEEAPEVQSCMWGSGFRIFPAESIASLVAKFPGLKFARLTAPGGRLLIVNAERVTDCDARSPVLDAQETRSVLLFGAGALVPRIGVRETREELAVIWTKLGLPTGLFVSPSLALAKAPLPSGKRRRKL